MTTTPRHVRTLDFRATIEGPRLCLAAFLLSGRSLLAFATRPVRLLEDVSEENREAVEALLEVWRSGPADPSAEYAELAKALEHVQFSLVLSEPQPIPAGDETGGLLLAQLTRSRPEDVVWRPEVRAFDV